MAQSLCKIYLHIIFHVKTSSPAIQAEHLDRVHQYIGQLINLSNNQSILVGGVADHVHLLCLLSSTETVAHLVEKVKRNSSRWLKTLSPSYASFAWQSGYAAFSVNHSVVDSTREYIANQAMHHSKRSFQEEYMEFLRKYHVNFDERYVLSD